MKKFKKWSLQGSVFTPILFNIYTNDQLISNNKNVKYFIYVDDSAITIQEKDFKTVKKTCTLAKMNEYF